MSLPINIALEIEQEQREKYAASAIEAAIAANTDRYYEGKFDGVIGESPKLPEDCYYWDGYVVGMREYWLKKLDRTVPTEM
jgi:hypothetical protein